MCQLWVWNKRYRNTWTAYTGCSGKCHCTHAWFMTTYILNVSNVIRCIRRGHVWSYISKVYIPRNDHFSVSNATGHLHINLYWEDKIMKFMILLKKCILVKCIRRCHKKGKGVLHVTWNWFLTISSPSINCSNMKVLLIIAMPVELHWIDRVH